MTSAVEGDGRTGDLVVHGHFYQPPRENPWTGAVPVEPSAAPYHDWNERITDECYRPCTAVEVVAADGRTRSVNLFEHLSFNVGPTLLSWLEAHHRDVYDAVVAADGTGGRAMAQAYGHAILPLCSDRDLRTQVRWGVADFRHRFGRAPEGLWLPETAVSERVLAVVAEEGLRWTVLAPGQLRAVRPLVGAGPWQDLTGDQGEPLGTVLAERAYRWCHPARPDLGLDLVVYDGALSHRLAFGAPTAADLVAWAGEHSGGGGVVVAACDGETFGHHHRGAEQTVAQALAVDAPAAGLAVPTLRQLLERRPPTHQALVRTSAWSCAHGVGRWITDCGCHTGGDPGWNQAWREPLRNALDTFRHWAGAVMDGLGPALLHDPWLARDAYGDVVVGARPYEDFAAEHVVARFDAERARTLLEAQRYGLLMYTSCGWFFNDLAGLETVQVLRYAARSMDLYRELGEEPPVSEVLAELARARSNDPAQGDGRRIWVEQVDGSRPS